MVLFENEPSNMQKTLNWDQSSSEQGTKDANEKQCLISLPKTGPTQMEHLKEKIAFCWWLGVAFS